MRVPRFPVYGNTAISIGKMSGAPDPTSRINKFPFVEKRTQVGWGYIHTESPPHKVSAKVTEGVARFDVPGRAPWTSVGLTRPLEFVNTLISLEGLGTVTQHEM